MMMKWVDGKSGCQSTMEREERDTAEKSQSGECDRKAVEFILPTTWLVGGSRGRSDDKKQKEPKRESEQKQSSDRQANMKRG